MARRWIMVELGAHCHSLVIPRLKKVIDGKTRQCHCTMSWNGAAAPLLPPCPHLIVIDRWGTRSQSRIHRCATGEALAKLKVCLRSVGNAWWQLGHSCERDFIYVTTQNLPLSSCWRCPMKSARSGAAGVLRRFSTESRRPERQSAGRN